MTITQFRGAYAFLSNFYIEPDGSHVEGEYQRAKCAIAWDRDRFEGLSPADAKRLGRRVEIRPDWETVKVEIMLFYVAKKFKDHPSLRDRLLQTGTTRLEEGNTWGDRYWGMVGGRGLNALGIILMDVRESLR